MIMGEIKRFMRDDGMIKISRTMKENGWKIKVAAQRLGQELGRQATVDEIGGCNPSWHRRRSQWQSRQTGMWTLSIVRSISRRARRICLIDQVVAGENASVGYVSRTAVARANTGETDSGVDAEKEHVINHVLLEQLLDTLSDKGTQTDPSALLRGHDADAGGRLMLGISQVQVSRLEKKILLRLRQQLDIKFPILEML